MVHEKYYVSFTKTDREILNFKKDIGVHTGFFILRKLPNLQ